MRALVTFTIVSCASFASCGGDSRRVSDYRESSSDLRTFSQVDAADLERARAALDRGEFGVARTILEKIAAARPDDLWLAVMIQEASFAPAGAEQRLRMVDAARRRAQDEGSVTALLLAARIDPEPARALSWARAAVQLAPREPWAHYAVGFLEARAGDWTEGQARIERALELDPGHRAARRMEAAILARSGKADDAAEALRVWIEASRGDPRIASRERVSAQLDLAQVYVQDGDDERALGVLRSIPDAGGDALRKLCLEAAVEQGLGHPGAALERARDAQTLDATAVLPRAQQAILLQHHLADPAAALAAWSDLLECVRRQQGLDALIQGLRARVVLERGGVLAP